MKGKVLFLFLCCSVFVLAFWLGVWTARAEGHAHYMPEYAKVSIVPILQKEKLDATDYEVLFRQTGMSRLGVDELRERKGQSNLLYLQAQFFEEVEMVCLRDFFVVQSERLVDAESERTVFLPTVQTGDILISFSGHVFGWRNGHAAIVVDAQDGKTLEAITLGSDSRICNIEKWAEYPCYALLRLRDVSAEERAEIAAYAEENLVGVAYRLLSFSGDVKESEMPRLQAQDGATKTIEPASEEVDSLSGTHCAHLVWAAYARFGYDLNSDGGWVVTPRDIFDSDLLEVVQVYGINPSVVKME